MEMRCRLHMHLRAAWTGFHVLDSGWGLLWRIIRGIWILDYFGFWQTYLLAIRRLRLNLHSISDALRVDSGVFQTVFPWLNFPCGL